MTPENKIANALHNIACCLAAIAGILFAMCITAHCTPLLPPLGYEIGEPPAPPPNPNIQYWYTMDIPTHEGVFPVEVYTPALPRIVASDLEPIIEIGDPPRLVDVPEPGTGWLALATMATMIVWMLTPQGRKALEEE